VDMNFNNVDGCIQATSATGLEDVFIGDNYVDFVDDANWSYLSPEFGGSNLWRTCALDDGWYIDRYLWGTGWSLWRYEPGGGC
jgi:hypothetical protein